MEDDFRVHASDTIPITSGNGKGDEVKPLQQEKDVNSSNGTLPSPQKDASARYRNLESETSDGGDASKINSIHLEFASPGSDSVWSIPSSSASTNVQTIKWYKHPKVREHWKIVLASFVLFFIGLCLCVTGIILEALQVQSGGIFICFVVGVFCFIPGVYHVIAVYYAVHGKRGFRFYNLPLFN